MALVLLNNKVMTQVRTRFAPSPTGALHLGGARTALFNWFFARHHGGKFILRIEDSDPERSTEEFVQAIIQGLTWLGLNWDEGPYFQSQRRPIYQQHAEQLLKEKKGYLCYCSSEELETKRKEALAAGRKPRYDGTCRNLKEARTDRPAAIRFRSSDVGQTIVEDAIKGTVIFDNRELDDLIIVRSDGTPTYNFSVVVDDVTMGITHVIRGDDHLNNTPRQIQLYQALGYPTPRFAHLPLILGVDKARLSKRHGATSLLAYQDMGYLPEAMVNYLARLGWSHGDQEIFSITELIEKFSLEEVGKSAGIFNPEKLLWLNAHYIKQSQSGRLAGLLKPFLDAKGWEAESDEWLVKVIDTLKERAKSLAEMAALSQFYFGEKVEYERKAAAKYLKPEWQALFPKLAARLDVLHSFNKGELERALKAFAQEHGLKFADLAQPVRVALTGSDASPPLFDVMEILGKSKVLLRLKEATSYMPG